MSLSKGAISPYMKYNYFIRIKGMKKFASKYSFLNPNLYARYVKTIGNRIIFINPLIAERYSSSFSHFPEKSLLYHFLRIKEGCPD
jgi:hypothetical protein